MGHISIGNTPIKSVYANTRPAVRIYEGSNLVYAASDSVDTVPYLFRATDNEVLTGCKVNKIVGASVPIIQLFTKIRDDYVLDDITVTKNNDGSITLNGTNTSENSYQDYPIIYATIPVKNGHQYYWGSCVGFDASKIMYFITQMGGYRTAGTGLAISNCTEDSNASFIIRVKQGATFNNTKIFPILIDLTATFGTTVANRLYELEQAQAGAGIAKAKEILVKDYYPYNVTAFTHTKTTGKQNVGFNLFDLSKISSQTYATATITGTKISLTGTYYASWLIEMLAGYTYYIRADVSGAVSNGLFRFVYTDGSLSESSYGKNTLFTPTKDVRAILVYASYDGTSKTTVYDKVCVNLHRDGERDGEYEPYQEWNYPTEDRELKGILSLDAQDNWVADGDEYLPSGVVDEKYLEQVSNGTEDWVDTYGSTNEYGIRIFSLEIAELENAGKGIANFGGIWYQDRSASIQLESCGTNITGHRFFVAIKVSRLSEETVTAFKTWLASNNITAIIERETTAQSSATPYTELQNIYNCGTEKWIDNRDVPMPVGHMTEYLPSYEPLDSVLIDATAYDGKNVIRAVTKPTVGKMYVFSGNSDADEVYYLETENGVFVIGDYMLGNSTDYFYVYPEERRVVKHDEMRGVSTDISRETYVSWETAAPAGATKITNATAGTYVTRAGVPPLSVSVTYQTRNYE